MSKFFDLAFTPVCSGVTERTTILMFNLTLQMWFGGRQSIVSFAAQASELSLAGYFSGGRDP